MRAILETCRSLFFETGLLFVFCSLLFGNTEKVSQKDSQKSARRASGGIPSRWERNFHFCSRAPKWDPKWNVLEAKVITILLLVRPCRENRPSKSFNFFDTISEPLVACGSARDGLARPEGGYLPGEPPHPRQRCSALLESTSRATSKNDPPKSSIVANLAPNK